MKTYYASADQDEGYSYGNYDHIRTPGGDDRASHKPQQFSFAQPLQNFQPDVAPLYSSQQAPQVGHGYPDSNNDELRSSRSNAQKFGSYMYSDNSSVQKPEVQMKTSYTEGLNREELQRLIAGNSPVNPYHVSNNDRIYEPGYSESIPRNEKPQNHYMNVTPYKEQNANQAQTAYQISPVVNEDNYTYGQQYSPELNKPNQNFFNDQHTSTTTTTTSTTTIKKFTIPVNSLQNLNHNQLIASITAQQAHQGYNPQSVLTPESVHAQQYSNRSQDTSARRQVVIDHSDYYPQSVLTPESVHTQQHQQQQNRSQALVDHSEGYNPQSILTPESVHVQQYHLQGANPQIFVDHSAEAKNHRRPSNIENNYNHNNHDNNHNQNYVQPQPQPRQSYGPEKEEKQFGAVETNALEDTLEYHDFSDDGDDIKDDVGAYYQDLADQPLQEADVTGKVANTPNKGLIEEYNMNMNINGNSIRVSTKGSESQRQSQRQSEPVPQVNHPQPHVVGKAAWNELQNVDKGNRNNTSHLQLSQQRDSATKNNGNSHDDNTEEMERIRRELAQAEERLEGLINQNTQKEDKSNNGHKKVSAAPEEKRQGDNINKQNHAGLVAGELWVLDVPDSHRKEDITAKVPKKASKVLTRLNKVNLIAYLFDKADHHNQQ